MSALGSDQPDETDRLNKQLLEMFFDSLPEKADIDSFSHTSSGPIYIEDIDLSSPVQRPSKSASKNSSSTSQVKYSSLEEEYANLDDHDIIESMTFSDARTLWTESEDSDTHKQPSDDQPFTIESIDNGAGDDDSETEHDNPWGVDISETQQEIARMAQELVDAGIMKEIFRKAMENEE